VIYGNVRWLLVRGEMGVKKTERLKAYVVAGLVHLVADCVLGGSSTAAEAGIRVLGDLL
jgi:hypothetical protein